MMADLELSKSAWHGFPRVLPREALLAVVDVLSRIWVNQGGSSDYDAQPGLTLWFDPTARGTRLRKQLAELESPQIFSDRDRAAGVPPLVIAPFTMSVGDGQFLLTPEGLGLLRALRAASQDISALVSLSWQVTDSADDFVMAFYRTESTKRIQSVVKLRQGDGPPMLPVSVALVALLLLNGNTVPGRGLARPSDEGLAAVDGAIVDIARAFVTGLGVPGTAKSVSDGAFSLYSGYALTEARRRLGRDLTSDPVGIAVDARGRVVDRLAAELARRPNVSEERVRAAVVGLGSAYDRHRAVLAAHGVANGIPGQGPSLAEDFAQAFRRSRAGDDHV